MSVAPGEVRVHLYDACKAELTLPEGNRVGLDISTKYPWGEAITITLDLTEPAEFALNLRIPAWANGAVAMINGRNMATAEAGKYLTLKRLWQPGDQVSLNFPMKITALVSHPFVAENRCAVALQRGPVVYCLESVDHPEQDLRELHVALGEGKLAGWEAQWRPELLDGVVVLTGEGYRISPSSDELYQPAGERPQGHEPVTLTAIPCYAWANRGDSALRVWLPVAPM